MSNQNQSTEQQIHSPLRLAILTRFSRSLIAGGRGPRRCSRALPTRRHRSDYGGGDGAAEGDAWDGVALADAHDLHVEAEGAPPLVLLGGGQVGTVVYDHFTEGKMEVGRERKDGRKRERDG